MAYEEDYRTPYKATCACGKGFLRYFVISSSNDWGQTTEENTPVELICDYCNKEYHYEQFDYSKYLVPNSLSFPTQKPHLNRKYEYTEKEEYVIDHTKQAIEDILSDMRAPKHHYIKDLASESAREFAEQWVSRTKKKKLSPMISYLLCLLNEYDQIKETCERKKIFIEKYTKEYQNYIESTKQIKDSSILLSFHLDIEYQDFLRKERQKFIEDHKYDDFIAQVSYDPSFKKNLTNLYWDSYYIKECVDPEYLSLSREGYGTPKITIEKKYFCVCQICGNKTELLSSKLKIYADDYGFYLDTHCPCHDVSSFEAKTMDILNRLGITYMREKSYEDLRGDSGKPLRFDFALYKSRNNADMPIIDLLIELQGPHHYKKGYYDSSNSYVASSDNDHNCLNEERFARQLRYDQKKREYCDQHKIKLECIKYTASNNYEQLEKKIIAILQKHGYKYTLPDSDDILFPC